ncbi:MAG TPA: NF038122 family metalloprotease [Phenylobacterium sp.]|jgi:hypothetical protein
MSDWIFDGGPSAGWQDAAKMHGQDVLHHPQTLLLDDGELSISSQARGGHGPPGGSGGGGTGSPTSTLVGSSGGLQIDLLWDTSVQAAPNWSDIEHSVVAAAQIFTNFTTHALLNIHVGLGEVNGSALANGALGESETQGYAVSYGTLTGALSAADANLVSSGLMASGAVTAVSALASKTFFVASAEAKALGLVNSTSSTIDGYIGFSAGSLISWTGAIGATQYDGVGVAAHEISEVMGRIGIEGSGSPYYTPLDLFRYSGLNQPDLSPAAGYFSTDKGATAANYFNAGANGGDAADWATTSSNTRDAFDAFGNPGVTTQVTRSDLLAVAALGYHPAGALATVTA